ncbi:hypothetical protein D3C74_251530 [compost metagenome]
MVFIQHLFRLGEIQVILGLVAPRQAKQPIHVVADNAAFRRAGRHFLQAIDFFLDLLPNVLRQPFLLELGPQLFRFSSPPFFLAELLLDRFHLLAQIIFLLRLLHLFLDALVDFTFQLKHFALVIQDVEEFLQPLADVDRFKDFLLIFDLQRQMAGNDVCQAPRFLNVRYRSQRLRRNLLG